MISYQKCFCFVCFFLPAEIFCTDIKEQNKKKRTKRSERSSNSKLLDIKWLYCALLFCGKLLAPCAAWNQIAVPGNYFWLTSILKQFAWLHCKYIHQLFFCWISDKVAAQRVFAIVLNCACCYQKCHKIYHDWNLKDYISTFLLSWGLETQTDNYWNRNYRTAEVVAVKMSFEAFGTIAEM